MTASGTSRRARTWPVVKAILGAVVVAGLVLDAVLHLDLAARYQPVRTSVLSQADLFRAEAVVALLAVLLLLVRPRRWTAAIAAVVAGSALAALLVYRYADLGPLGPIPSMYEPVWYGRKAAAAIAEAAALLAAVLLATVLMRRSTPEAGR
jgi:hypothetical protein